MNTLAEACIANILSFTTPLDVCRLSAVSKTFTRAANFENVWNHILPTDFSFGFAIPTALPTRKQLFFSVVHHPLLHHESQLLLLDRRSGKKCFMLAARALKIIWGYDQRYWRWISIPNIREVAELVKVYWFYITGNINIKLLSDDTLYVAYLVFKWNHDAYGFREPVGASVFLIVTHTDDTQPSMVTLMQNQSNGNGQCVKLRRDGWYEVELGQFFKRRGDLGEIEMCLEETKKLDMRKGLIVLGIEIRPMH